MHEKTENHDSKTSKKLEVIIVPNEATNQKLTIGGQTITALLQQNIITLNKAMLLDTWYWPEKGQIRSPLMDSAVLDSRINTLEDINALDYALNVSWIESLYEQALVDVKQVLLLGYFFSRLNQNPENASLFSFIERNILEGSIETIDDLDIALINPKAWELYENCWITKDKARDLSYLCTKDPFFSEILSEEPSSWRRKLLLDPNFTPNLNRENFNEIYLQLQKSLTDYPRLAKGKMELPPIIIIYFAQLYDYFKLYFTQQLDYINSSVLHDDSTTNSPKNRLLMAREILLSVKNEGEQIQASLLRTHFNVIARYARFFPTPLQEITLISNALEKSTRALQSLSVLTIQPSITPLLLLAWIQSHEKKNKVIPIKATFFSKNKEYAISEDMGLSDSEQFTPRSIQDFPT